MQFLQRAKRSEREFACIAAHDFTLANLESAEQLGRNLAEAMIGCGAGSILQTAKQITAAEILKQKAAKERKQENPENGKEVKAGNGVH